MNLTQVAVATALLAATMATAHAQALNLEEVVVTGTATRASKMKQSVSVSTMSTEAIETAAPSNAPGAILNFIDKTGDEKGGPGGFCGESPFS